jgi:L-alanine-DL-glutamate epimerase-like enolase superfamily enzyme
MQTGSDEATVERIEVSAYEIPTEAPESDGTLEWDSTIIVVVHAHSGTRTGLGYTYADKSVAPLIEGKLAEVVQGRDVMSVPAAWLAMQRAVRNLGQTGLTQMAIAAVDIALWDLKARVLEVPMVFLLGQWRDSVPVYGSGGFTSYSVDQLCEQLAGWVEQGIPRVKMKIGRNPEDDLDRVATARKAIGDGVELFVDANGAYDLKLALQRSYELADHGVTWYEEPIGSDDLTGLRLIRERCPAGMDVTAGEYGFDLDYFRRMLEAKAVDVLQADVTRCGGITGFLRVGPLCDAHHIPISAHTAPQIDAHACVAVQPLRHAEYFHDHVRIEGMLFDGALDPVDGALRPDPSRPGLGLELKSGDAQRYRVA